MAAKTVLIVAESMSSATSITGGVKICDIVDYKTYTNPFGQTVHQLLTPSGMLPAIKIETPADAAQSIPPPKHVNEPIATTYNRPPVTQGLTPQYDGSSFPPNSAT